MHKVWCAGVCLCSFYNSNIANAALFLAGLVQRSALTAAKAMLRVSPVASSATVQCCTKLQAVNYCAILEGLYCASAYLYAQGSKYRAYFL
jgi:hypothetical protein